MRSSIIVVVGNVTREQYLPVLDRQNHRSKDVRVIRVPDDKLREFLDTIEEDLNPDQMYTVALELFCERHNFRSEEVVEVVVMPGWDDDDTGEGASNHAFKNENYRFWPNLERVSLIHEDGWIEEI